MLKAVRADKSIAANAEIRKLYDGSFPDNERIPWGKLVSTLDDSRIMMVYYADDVPAGMSFVYIHESVVYLGYLAVEEKMRSKGYGTEILHMILDAYPESKIVVDIETVTEDSGNYKERRKRKDFYLRCGFKETGTAYSFYHVDYELLSYNGIVLADEFRDLILEHWGRFADFAVFRSL